jgi:hypothetical protein
MSKDKPLPHIPDWLTDDLVIIVFTIAIIGTAMTIAR